MESGGIFITFEGGEGCGKSTQVKLLSDHLQKMGVKFIVTREPGGTENAEQIRQILLGKERELTPLTEFLLISAARADHWAKKIKPALDQGYIVICDRFYDSSLVYQSFVYSNPISVEPKLIHDVTTTITGGRFPDRTYIFDLDPVIGLQRTRARSLQLPQLNNRFDNLDLSFHQKVRQGFLDIFNSSHRQQPGNNRYVLIDASRPVEDVYSIITKDLSELVGGDLVA